MASSNPNSINARKVDPANAAERAARRASLIEDATRSTDGYAEFAIANEQKEAVQSDKGGRAKG